MASNYCQFVIEGEPASKSNQRKIVSFGGRPALIKSDKARKYEKTFHSQCPKLDEMLEGDLAVCMRIFYASRRPDLDESLILDLMQGFVYKNDRQVKHKNVFWGLDKERPRSIIRVCPIEDGLMPEYLEAS